MAEKVWNSFEEKKARAGKGSGLYRLDHTDGLFCLLAPFIKVPFIKKEVSELEIKVACAEVVGKLPGVETLASSEAEIYLHRDTIRLLEKYSGQTMTLMSVISDFVGYKYDATITYTPSDVEMDALMQGTVKITPLTEPIYIDNCKPMLKPTVKFASAISGTIELEETAGTYIQEILLSPADATFTVTSDNATIATATQSASKLTITGKKAGSTVVTLKASKAGYASWETTIHVSVPEPVVAPTNK